MKKDIKFSTRMASADREKIRALAAKAHMSVRKHQNMVFIIFFNLIAVPTEKFFLFIQAHMTKIHA